MRSHVVLGRALLLERVVVKAEDVHLALKRVELILSDASTASLADYRALADWVDAAHAPSLGCAAVERAETLVRHDLDVARQLLVRAVQHLPPRAIRVDPHVAAHVLIPECPCRLCGSE